MNVLTLNVSNKKLILFRGTTIPRQIFFYIIFRYTALDVSDLLTHNIKKIEFNIRFFLRGAQLDEMLVKDNVSRQQ